MHICTSECWKRRNSQSREKWLKMNNSQVSSQNLCFWSNRRARVEQLLIIYATIKTNKEKNQKKQSVSYRLCIQIFKLPLINFLPVNHASYSHLWLRRLPLYMVMTNMEPNECCCGRAHFASSSSKNQTDCRRSSGSSLRAERSRSGPYH